MGTLYFGGYRIPRRALCTFSHSKLGCPNLGMAGVKGPLPGLKSLHEKIHIMPVLKKKWSQSPHHHQTHVSQGEDQGKSQINLLKSSGISSGFRVSLDDPHAKLSPPGIFFLRASVLTSTRATACSATKITSSDQSPKQDVAKANQSPD